MHKCRKIPNNSKERKQFIKDILEYVRKSPEYESLIDLGLIEDSGTFTVPALLQKISLVFISEIKVPGNNDNIKYTISKNQICIDYDRLVQLRYGHKWKKKDKKIFYKIGNGIITGLKNLYIIYFKRIYESELGDEINFIHNIPNEQLVLHIKRKWKSQYTKRIYSERLKTGNQKLKTEIVSSLNRK